jgi:hypothetical protein
MVHATLRSLTLQVVIWSSLLNRSIMESPQQQKLHAGSDAAIGASVAQQAVRAMIRSLLIVLHGGHKCLRMFCGTRTATWCCIITFEHLGAAASSSSWSRLSSVQIVSSC